MTPTTVIPLPRHAGAGRPHRHSCAPHRHSGEGRNPEALHLVIPAQPRTQGLPH